MTQFKVGDRVMVKNVGEGTITDTFTGVRGSWGSCSVLFPKGGFAVYDNPQVSLISDSETFHLLLVDGTEPCGQRYATIEEARTEAKRLLHEPRNQGKGITILRAVEYGRLPETEIEWRAIE